jgi:predicted metal-dependent hydrolase
MSEVLPGPHERSEVRYGSQSISYVLRRSPARSTVSIAVDRTSKVLVTAPAGVPMGKVDQVVLARARWIVERLRQRSEIPPAPPYREFVTGETFLYLGRQYRLRVDVGDDVRPLRLASGWLHVPVPRSLGQAHRGSYVRAALVDWYKRKAADRLPEHVFAWAVRIGGPRPPMVICEPRKRWGSTTSAGIIRLNWRTIQAPVPVLDYVVLHELVHLVHRDHGRDFWAAMGRVMPDYDERKRRLRDLGPRLEW